VPLPTYPFERQRYAIDPLEAAQSPNGAPIDATPSSLDRAAAADRATARPIVAALFAEVLGLDEVEDEESFFDLGGDSLIATQLLERIRQTLPVRLGLRSIFEAPTVTELAELIAATARGEIPERVAG
jgi:acyl carrier protein